MVEKFETLDKSLRRIEDLKWMFYREGVYCEFSEDEIRGLIFSWSLLSDERGMMSVLLSQAMEKIGALREDRDIGWVSYAAVSEANKWHRQAEKNQRKIIRILTFLAISLSVMVIGLLAWLL